MLLKAGRLGTSYTMQTIRPCLNPAPLLTPPTHKKNGERERKEHDQLATTLILTLTNAPDKCPAGVNVKSNQQLDKNSYT
jgi:hypothetical protein